MELCGEAAPEHVVEEGRGGGEGLPGAGDLAMSQLWQRGWGWAGVGALCGKAKSPGTLTRLLPQHLNKVL